MTINMETVRTAEEFIREDGLIRNEYIIKDIVPLMIEFAQMHVELALKAALEDFPYGGSDPVTYEDVKDIADSYPLTNIK